MQVPEGNLQRQQDGDDDQVEEVVNRRPGQGAPELLLAGDVSHRHQYIGHAGTDIGAHNHRNGPFDSHGSAGHHAHHYGGSSGGTLRQRRGQDTGHQPDQRVGCHHDDLPGQILAEKLESRPQQADANQKDVEDQDQGEKLSPNLPRFPFHMLAFAFQRRHRNKDAPSSAGNARFLFGRTFYSRIQKYIFPIKPERKRHKAVRFFL